MTECVKIKCDDCKFVEDCVDYGWEGCKKFTPKCPLCGGKGKYENGLGVVSRCYYCLGTGEVNDKGERNMTNEEWFCSLPTNEKATFIADNDGSIQIGDEVDYQNTVTRWIKWLKEKHE